MTPNNMMGAVQEDMTCKLFEFISEVVLMGVVCLIGFAGNTLCYIVLWHEKVRSALTFLLQAILISDLAVIWMLFIGDVVPSLGYVIPVLEDCGLSVCQHVSAVTRPLLFLAQLCVIWLTLIVAICRYIMLCKPAQGPIVGTVDFARKLVIIVMIAALLLTIPLTFDTSITLTHIGLDGKITEEVLINNYWYKQIYLNGFLFFAVHVIPMIGLAFAGFKLILVLQSIKRLRRALAPTFKAQNTDMTQVILTMTITVFVCYMPLTIQHGIQWSQGHVTHDCGQLQFYLDSFSKLFMAVNSSMKLLILGLFAHRFTEALKDTFCRKYKSSDMHIFGVYKCQDASEMTLMSQMDTPN